MHHSFWVKVLVAVHGDWQRPAKSVCEHYLEPSFHFTHCISCKTMTDKVVHKMYLYKFFSVEFFLNALISDIYTKQLRFWPKKAKFKSHMLLALSISKP